MPITTKKNITLYISIGLFLLSLICPCFDTGKDVGSWGQGAILLIMGIGWFIFPIPYGIWLANPALLFAWILVRRKPVTSFISSLVATVLALCFLLCKELLTDEGGSNYAPIVEHKIGYWLWLASMVTMLFGNLYHELTSNKKVD
jgi:hypothetical protein